MSICRLIASDTPLPEFVPDAGGVELIPFDSVKAHTNRAYGVCLEGDAAGWESRIAEYIRTALMQADAVEFWNVWFMDYYEFEDRPYVHRRTVTVAELTPVQIRETADAVIWNTPDKRYPERPSFYCLKIIK